MRIEQEALHMIWDKCKALECALQFPDGSDRAVHLYGGPGSGHVLRANGYIYLWDIDFEGLRLEENPHSCLQALAIAAKRDSVFAVALPQRPSQAMKCGNCNTGFIDFGEHQRYLVCKVCDGMGWTAG